jgi:hypothetical protein
MTDPQDAARERQRERAEHVEHILASVDPKLDEHAYPTSKEELAAQYGNAPMDLPNETESFGDVIDRLTQERFDTPAELREALLNELTGEAGPPAEANDQRDLEPFGDTDHG